MDVVVIDEGAHITAKAMPVTTLAGYIRYIGVGTGKCLTALSYQSRPGESAVAAPYIMNR